MRLEGKAVLVTGAAQGIGRACAELFVSQGAMVVVADKQTEAAKLTARALTKSGPGRAVPYTADVSRPDDVEMLVEDCIATCGKLDVVINNAAIVLKGDILSLSAADFLKVLDINLLGAFLVTQHAARHMVAEGIKGSIINMSSINGTVTIPDQLAYSVAKGGLNQLTRSCALALAPHGIRVNAIAPGSIATEMFRTVVTPEAMQTVLSRTPLGRPGEPEEIANVALFLASDDSSYITGEVIVADGGRMALNYVMPVADT